MYCSLFHANAILRYKHYLTEKRFITIFQISPSITLLCVLHFLFSEMHFILIHLHWHIEKTQVDFYRAEVTVEFPHHQSTNPILSRLSWAGQAVSRKSHKQHNTTSSSRDSQAVHCALEYKHEFLSCAASTCLLHYSLSLSPSYCHYVTCLPWEFVWLLMQVTTISTCNMTLAIVQEIMGRLKKLQN